MNTEQRPLALVTGASSGIGTELALELARRGHDLLLTGRDAVRLGEAAARIKVTGAACEILPLDLAAPDAVSHLLGWVGTRPLDVLVNNAGFGDSADVNEADPKTLAAMIGLNISALTLLTRTFVAPMVARRSGRILNIGSTASFSPIPGMAVYAASKAFVLSFSEALAEELSGTGVTVTVLCPGPTATRFADRAALGGSELFRSAMPADEVARVGIRALLAGRRVKVAGVSNALMAFSTRLAPRRLVVKIARSLMARTPGGTPGK